VILRVTALSSDNGLRPCWTSIAANNAEMSENKAVMVEDKTTPSCTAALIFRRVKPYPEFAPMPIALKSGHTG